MGFEPGRQKTGGRQKGTPNKGTTELQVRLKQVGIDPLQIIAENLSLLSEDKKVAVAIDLMGYLYPKRKATDTQSNQDGDDGDQIDVVSELGQRVLEATVKIRGKMDKIS